MTPLSQFASTYTLQIRVINGKLIFGWRCTAREITRARYLAKQATTKSIHAEIANLFFSSSTEEDEESGCQKEDSSKKLEEVIDNSLKDVDNQEDSEKVLKETPFQSAPHIQDVAYTVRHVEEAWIHYLRAGDVQKLKKLAVCSFDFLLASAQMISVSYLRCVLEHARRYLLERDLELVYYAVRKSSDVLTRDPLQLGAQLICWLRPVAEDGGDFVST